MLYPNLVRVLQKEGISIESVAEKLNLSITDAQEKVYGNEDFLYQEAMLIINDLLDGKYTWTYIWWCNHGNLPHPDR